MIARAVYGQLKQVNIQSNVLTTMVTLIEYFLHSFFSEYT